MTALDEHTKSHLWKCKLMQGFGECDCGQKKAAAELDELKERCRLAEFRENVLDKENDKLRADLDEARKFIILLGNRDQAVQQVVQIWLAAHPKE